MYGASALLIVAAAVAGYIFTGFCYKWKYKVARESGYKLYLSCLSFGFIYLLLSWVISLVAYALPQWLAFDPIIVLGGINRTLAICLGAILIAAGAANSYNKLVPYSKEINLDKAWQKDDFDSICQKAMLDFKPIALSLESGKVYVGYVVDTLSPEEENSHLTILPIYSGYRAEITLKFILASKYQVVIDSIFEDEAERSVELEDYFMAFPREKINSLHIFNDHLHKSVSSNYPKSPGLTHNGP